MKKLEQAILNELRECDLFKKITRNWDESHYVVAGGYVFDKYIGYKNNLAVKENDIDVFVIKSDEDIQKDLNKRKTMNSEYNQMQFKYAKVHKVYVDGKYNVVEIQLDEMGKELIKEKGYEFFWKEHISYSFDINICMLFVDFKNDCIVKTTHFDEYELKNEMMIINSKNIFNSYGRCFVKDLKYKKLGVNFYKDKWLSILFFSYFNQGYIYLKDMPDSGMFYFNYEKIIKKNKVSVVDLFSPLFIVQNERKNYANYEISLQPNLLSIDNDVYKMINAMQLKLSENNLYFKGFTGYNHNGFELRHKYFFDNLLSGSVAKKSNKIKIFVSNIFGYDVFSKNNLKAFNNDFSQEKLISIIDLFAVHRLSSVTSKMINSGWSVNDVISFFIKVKKSGRFYQSFIGKLEVGYADEYLSKYSNPDLVFDVMYRDYIEERVKTDVALVKSINISDFKFCKYIKELTTRNELEEEGHYMSHCVGGYDAKVRNNYCRIFHVKYKNYESTLEVDYDYNNENIKVRQHYTFFNKKVNKVQKFLSQRLIEFLNNEQKNNHSVFDKKNLNEERPHPVRARVRHDLW